MKVFKLYFLALLLICALPVFAQEAQASEGTPEQSEAAAPAQEAPAENAQQNEAAAAEQPAEAAPAEEAAPAKEEAEPAKEEAPKEEAEPAKEEAPKEEAAKEEAPAGEEGQSDLEAELAAQAEDADAETAAGDKAADKDKGKKSSFTLGINNGFSHGFAKERKSFAYTLNVFANYDLPLAFAISVDVGLRELYRYGMSEAVATEAGLESSSDLNYSKFDGTPFNIHLSKGFGLFAGFVGSIGIGVSIPFTSKELWDVYDVRTILGVDLGLAKNFQLPKEVTLGLTFGFSYAKTFAEHDAAWDPYSNEPLGYLQNHDIGLVVGLGVGYKGFGFKLTGGYNFGSDYKLAGSKYYYDDWDTSGTIEDSSWYYLFSFGATASYTIKGFVFAVGVRTNAPEFDNGNYEGFTERPGDPEVKDGATNYPFKAKYTTVFANIGYSYSF